MGMKILPLILLLTACSTPLPIPDIDGKTYTFTLHIAKKLPPGIKGKHVYYPLKDEHHIFLREDIAPKCLGHEVWHMIVGNFHKGKVSTDHC